MFAAVQLHRLAAYSRKAWPADPTRVSSKATELFEGIRDAIPKYGMRDGAYCFEVDGFGDESESSWRGCLSDYDDANQPSLLGLPLIDPDNLVHDKQAYLKTRQRILSSQNRNYHCPRLNATTGALLDAAHRVSRGGRCGLGSEHTSGERVWPMGTIVQMATSTDESERAECLAQLLDVARLGPVDGVPTLHESYEVDNPGDYTRADFEWVNALFARYACGPCYSSSPEQMPVATVHVTK